MDKLQQSAITLELCAKLKEHGSWCGETHVQKAEYLLEELLKVPLGLDFILYKHGPFSFELRDRLTELRADGRLSVVPQPYPYGPSLKVTDEGETLRKRFPKTVEKYHRAIAFVASELGGMGVSELERLATAVFVRSENATASKSVRVQRLVELKPHVTQVDAEQAVDKVDGFVKEIGRRKLMK